MFDQWSQETVIKKKKKRIKSVDKEKKFRHAKLSWQIIGAKFLYYEGQKHGINENAIPDDSDYDNWEEEYKNLSKELGLPTTATDMVDFDDSRASCRLVKQHLIATNGRCPMRSFKLKLVNKENPIQEIRKKVNVFQKTLKEVLEELNVDEKIAKKIRVRMKKKFKV